MKTKRTTESPNKFAHAQGDHRRRQLPARQMLPEHWQRLLDHLPTDWRHRSDSHRRRRGLAIGLGIYGLRGIEVRTVRHAHLDVEQATLYVPTAKGGPPRRIQLAEDFAVALSEHTPARYRSPEFPLLATIRRKSMLPHQLMRYMHQLQPIIGRLYRFHDLRHTLACQVYAQTKCPLTVMRLLGHTNLRVTDHYLRTAIQQATPIAWSTPPLRIWRR